MDQAFVLATPHFDRHTTYVAMSRHKDDVRLYANKKDFKNDARLHQSLGRHGEKLSTLDFTDARTRYVEQEAELRPSFLDRIKFFFLRGQDQQQKQSPEHQYSGRWMDAPAPEKEAERHTPTRTLDQQEFVALREEFHQKATLAEAQYSIEQEPQPDNTHRLER